ncbi:MAG: hypothetical protein H2076_09560 [Planctomycetes bacterium]|nr:hypothetical protein [Planctomycetota bacterium]
MVKPLQTLRNLPRLRDISWVLARHGLKDLSTRLGAGLGTRLFGFENPHIPFAGRLRLAFQELGPIYIKLGQLIASRPDIFPEDLVSEMERLRDDVDPVSFDEVKPVIEKSLGGEIRQLFRQFEEIPVASASIAQVYKAITLDGRSVAVKVRKPGIEKLIERDLGLLDQFAEALSRQPESGGFDPVAVVRELHHALEGELNFFMEKNSIDRIRDFFEDDPSVAIPETIADLCTGEVLVMDWFDGIPAGKMEMSDPRRQDLVRLCSRSLFTMMFRHGHFHADPHPSNIIWLDDGRIGWIDFGMTGILTSDLRWRLSRMLKALVERDYEELARQVIHVGHCHGEANSFALTQSIAQHLDPYLGLPLAQVDLPALLKSILQIATEHRIEIAPGFVRMTRALVLLEGIVEKYDPDFDMASELEPMLRELVREKSAPDEWVRRLTDQTVENLEALGEAPALLTEALRRATRGRIRVESEITGLDRLSRRIEGASRRLVEGGVASALIVASALFAISGMNGFAIGCGLLSAFLLSRILFGYLSPWQ